MAATVVQLVGAARANNVTEMRRLIAAGVDKDAIPPLYVMIHISLVVCVIWCA
jgi:hypothetical protein